MTEAPYKVLELGDDQVDIAVDVFSRFFAEEGFTGTGLTIWGNVRRMLVDPHHWVGLVWLDRFVVGVVTLTTMLYVEWGRLGEFKLRR